MPKPAKNQIHLWTLTGRADTDPGPALLCRLREDEQNRARRFRSPAHGAQWAIFRAGLRNILSHYTPLAPLEIEFQARAQGKPVLAQAGAPPLFFNLSHAGSMALVAITRRAPIGVDLEPIRHLNDREALVKRFFSHAEQAAFAGLPDKHRDQCFFNIWTRKEAVIKANGVGLSAPLDAFDVPLGTLAGWHLPTVRSPLPAATHFPLQQLKPAAGYTGAVALELADTACDNLPTIEHFRFEPDWPELTRRTNR